MSQKIVVEDFSRNFFSKRKKEKERLDMKIAELESLTNIMNDSDLKNMEKVNDPNFLVIKDDVQYVYNDKK